MIDEQCPIGVFDSGVGGISTLRTLSAMLPDEDFIFYGDSANAPYGEKTAEQVRALTDLAVQELRNRNVKAIVIACNTATSAAKPSLMKRYPDIPFLGIEPALKQAVDEGKKNILVMATPLTLSLAKFHRQVERFSDRALITPLPCPGLAALIEQGAEATQEIDGYLTRLFAQLASNTASKSSFDAVVLGCTHYPFIADLIAAHLGIGADQFTGFEGLGKNLTRQLKQRGFLKHKESAAATGDTTPRRKVDFLSSRNTDTEIALYRRLFEHGFSR